MKKISLIRILSLFIIISFHIVVFMCTPISIKGQNNDDVSFENLNKSIATIVALKDEEVVDATTGYAIYKSKTETFMITSNSLIKTGNSYLAKFGNKSVALTLAGTDDNLDLAVLKFQSNLLNINVLKTSSSENLKNGEILAMIGNINYSYRDSNYNIVQEGYIAKNDVLSCDENKYLYNCRPLMYVDLKISSSSFGSPLFNELGYLVAMVSSFKVEETTTTPMAFAVSIDDIMVSLNNILKGNKTRADLNLYIKTIEELTLSQRKVLNTNLTRGTIVNSFKNSASVSGIGINHIITKINGVSVATTIDLIREVYRYQKGTVIGVTTLSPTGKISTFYIKG